MHSDCMVGSVSSEMAGRAGAMIPGQLQLQILERKEMAC